MKAFNKFTCASATIFSCLSMTACHIPTTADGFAMTSGGAGLTGQSGDMKYMVYDVPPQVVYRIDEHRFFTLENYKDCDHGGIIYYNDTKLGKKVYLNGGSSTNDILTANSSLYWKGQIIYSASDEVLAYPVRVRSLSDRATNNGAYIIYIKNGIRYPLNIAGDMNDGKDTSIQITHDAVYFTDNKTPYKYKTRKFSIPNSYSDFTYLLSAPESNNSSTKTTIFSCDSQIIPSSQKNTAQQEIDPKATGIQDND
ncbi:hypothetical protein CWS43_02460 [Rahnella sp. AA]|uniref:T6SS immunity protein Tli3 family protein n=1 Tax=Rahnella sp. AA TaxID=2057180 RepID=UPI000C332B11|nr:hypothetical protein [Rahnella sp. AA]PKE32780.1 hypothetical protein CWS43_02460 [Rahnella sp. AA]